MLADHDDDHRDYDDIGNGADDDEFQMMVYSDSPPQ